VSKKLAADLVIVNANQMCTLRGPRRARIKDELQHLGTVPKAAVAMEHGKIVAVGSTEEIRNRVDTKYVETVDATGKTILPGFVDPHTHLIFAGSREDELVQKIKGATYMDILREGGGIHRTTTATRNASREKLGELAKKRLDRMLALGTTTVEAKSGYGLTVKDEIKCLEVVKRIDGQHTVDLVPTFLGAHVVPPEYQGDPGGYIDHIIGDMLPKISEKKLANFCDVFCDEGIFNADQSLKLLKEALVYGLTPKMHCDEIKDICGIGVAAEVSAASVDHLVVTSDENFKVLAKQMIIGVMLPGTPFMLMENKYPRARKMIAEGVPVALATDLNPNCWTESMQMIITLACVQMKMTPAEAISASTINAAYAIGCGDRVGSIEVGKKADIIILDMPNYMQIPYRFGGNNVDLVIKSGKIVVE
jgi:imidazolonepropionase